MGSAAQRQNALSMSKRELVANSSQRMVVMFLIFCDYNTSYVFLDLTFYVFNDAVLPLAKYFM